MPQRLNAFNVHGQNRTPWMQRKPKLIWKTFFISKIYFISSIFEAMEGGGEINAAAAKHKVVVIGGGIAGSLLARSIQNYADVTLIDPYGFVSLHSFVPILFSRICYIMHCIRFFLLLWYIRKEYFEIPWANLRSKVDPTFAERALFNHSKYLTNGKIIISTATNATETEVLTADFFW